LIKYLENNEPPAVPINMDHPWAKSPTTIGSISSMYLSILFLKEHREHEDGFK